MSEEKWIDAHEAAAIAGVDRASIYRWAREGSVRKQASPRNRDTRFSEADVRAVMKAREEGKKV